MPPDLFVKTDTRVIDVSARKISGRGRSVRIEVSHFFSRVRSYANFYVRHCATTADSCLRAKCSGIRLRIRGDLSERFGEGGKSTHAEKISFPKEQIIALMLTDTSDLTSNNSAWLRNQYVSTPRKTTSPQSQAHRRRAQEGSLSLSLSFRESVLSRQCVYASANTHSRLDLGLQILQQNGWAPECVIPNNVDIDRALPPSSEPKRLNPGYCFRKVERLTWLPGTEHF